MSDEVLILLALIGPFVAASLSLLAPRRLAEVWQYGAALVSLLACLGLAVKVLDGNSPSLTLVPVIPGLDLALRVDPLGITFAVLASALWRAAALYSSGDVRAETMSHRPRYFACFAASIGAALGVAFSANLLTFLLFYELLTLMTYPLVAHKQSPEAIAAGRRYLAFALSAGMVLLVAIAWTWQTAGTLDFRPGGILDGHVTGAEAAALFALFLAGGGVKAAIMPVHSWLPTALAAAAPVSALLHAVAVVKAGVFACIRILSYVFGPEMLSALSANEILMIFCGATIVIGSLMAVRQDNLKRRLAYSTIVHLSYIVLGAALMTPLGTTGAVFHMANHGLCKITLFLCAGAIHATFHLENVSQLAGLARRMPWTCAAFTVASLGLMGVPGLCGFVSKQFLVRGAWQADEITYLGIMLGGSVFTAIYLLPIVRTVYFDRPHDDAQAHTAPQTHHAQPHATGGAVALMRWPLVATAGLVVIFGILPWAINVQYALAMSIIRSIYGGGI